MLNFPTDHPELSLDLDFDPAKFKTPATAAKAFHKALSALAKEMGEDPEKEIWIRDPKANEAAGYGRCWQVAWESGPYDWGVSLSLRGLYNHPHWYTEPYWGFDVCFFS